MGIYRDKVLPRIVDKACGMKAAELRLTAAEQACTFRIG